MKTLLRLEYLALLILGIFGFANTNYAWWWFIILFLTPDISILGYLINPRIGAVLYNIFHHLGLAIVLYIVGKYFNSSLLELTGTILFSHSSFDRLLGYGLKYNDHFQNTHLGRIGKD